MPRESTFCLKRRCCAGVTTITVRFISDANNIYRGKHLQTKRSIKSDFVSRLIELQRRTNLKGAKFASELGIKPSYVSQLRNGKKPPTPQLEKLVDEKLGNVPPSEGMVAVRVEVPERLYLEARNMSRTRSFASLDEFMAHLIRQEIERRESPIAGATHPTAPNSFPKPPKRISDDAE